MSKLIAEIGSNWNGDPNRLVRIIEQAVGFYAVKLQVIDPDRFCDLTESFTSPTLDTYLRQLRDTKVTLDTIKLAKEHCDNNNLKFVCSVFYTEAVELVYPYVDFYKISSYDLLRKDLIRGCLDTDKPVMISTGMATWREIDEVYEMLPPNRHYLLHCVTAYPSFEHELDVVAEMHERYPNVFKGWSDHSTNLSVLLRAIYKYNVDVVEVHFDSVDGRGNETKHSWNRRTIAPVLDMVAEKHHIDGNRLNKPCLTELYERNRRADPVTGLRHLT